MARFSIAYAHPFGEPATDHPLAVLAQDDTGVALEPVPQDVEALAKSIGLPSQTFVAWAPSKRSMLIPIQMLNPETKETDEIPVTDKVWFERYISGGNEGTYTFGPISESIGPADYVAKSKASGLRPKA